jgi:hypothetical protein
LWVVAALAGLAVVIVLALCVPLDMVLHIDVYGRPRFRTRLMWLFGHISKEVTKESKKPEEKKRVVKGKRKPSRSRIRAVTIFKILRTRGLLSQFKILLKGVLSCLKIRELGADFRVGLDDPAETGLLFALIGPATFFLPPSLSSQIKVQPSFGDEAFCEGNLHGTIRLQPIQLVPPFLRFTFSLPALRAVKMLVLTKWTGKK